MATKKTSSNKPISPAPNPKPRVTPDTSERKNADLMRQFMTPDTGNVEEKDAVASYRKDALNAAKNGVRLNASQTYYTRNSGKYIVSDDDIRKDQQKEKTRKIKQRER